MKEVKLRMNEQLKYKEIKKCVDGYQSKERTSQSKRKGRLCSWQ